MDTSQYDQNNRKKVKRILRSELFADLLKKGREDRSHLEQVITKRNDRIALLEKLLRDKGYEKEIPK